MNSVRYFGIDLIFAQVRQWPNGAPWVVGEEEINR